MKVLITGADGLVGSRFCELYSRDFEFLTPDLNELDIVEQLEVEKYVSTNKPEIIINFAAYTNVKEAEKQRDFKSEIAWKINVEGTENLVKAAKNNGAFLIQISTDFVFSPETGQNSPYSENSEICLNPDLMTWYGYTKAVAETKIPSDHAIVRISYPYRTEFSDKLDFARTMLEKYKIGEMYPLFSNQKITPTFIDLFCEALAKIVKTKSAGIFHVASSNIATPYEFGKYFLENYFGKIIELKNSENEESFRHFNSALATENSQKALGIKFPTWQESVDELVAQLKNI